MNQEVQAKTMTTDRANFIFHPILPGDPPQSCPELLTETEAVRYLRLDGIKTNDPALTLRYYRQKGLLRATQVGKSIRYRRIELDRLLEKLTDSNPR